MPTPGHCGCLVQYLLAGPANRVFVLRQFIRRLNSQHDNIDYLHDTQYGLLILGEFDRFVQGCICSATAVNGDPRCA